VQNLAGYVKTNDGVRLYYEEAGSGRPIVLIHGGRMSLLWWRKQLPELSRQFGVIALDLRAAGRSDKPAAGHRTARQAKDIRDLIEALGLYDVTLVGWSMGARVVLAYYELFRAERLLSIVLVDETPKHDMELEESAKAAVVHTPPNLAETTHVDDAQQVRESIPTMFSPENAPRLTREELDWMVAESLRMPLDAALLLKAEYLSQDWRGLLPSIETPTLILTGRHGGVYPACAYMAAHIPGAKLVVFEHSGHVPFYEEPAKFNAVVAEFVASLPLT